MSIWKKLFGGEESPKPTVAEGESIQPTATPNPQPPSKRIEPLLRMLGSNDNDRRSLAEKALTELGASKEKIINRYVELLWSTGNPQARRNAVSKLGDLGDKRAIDPLWNCGGGSYSTEDEKERNYCEKYCSLAKLGDKRAIEPLLGLVAKGYVDAERALKDLGASKEQMTSAYIAMLSEPAYKDAEVALERLGASKEQMVDGYIAALLAWRVQHGSRDCDDGPVPTERRNYACSNAIKKLGALGDNRAIKPLLGLLANADHYSSTATSLTQLGVTAERIEKALKEPGKGVEP